VQQTNLFLPELYFIDHLADAFPGALMPQQLQPLIWRGEQITPLVPLHAYLLDRFTPEQLSSAVYFQPIFGDEGGVRVILALPNTSQRWTQDYVLKEENAFDGLPILEVYPNISCAGWQEYYGFYFDAGLGKDTFQGEFDNVESSSRFTDQEGAAIKQYE